MLARVVGKRGVWCGVGGNYGGWGLLVCVLQVNGCGCYWYLPRCCGCASIWYISLLKERQLSGRDFGYCLNSAVSSNFKMPSKNGDITSVSTMKLKFVNWNFLQRSLTAQPTRALVQLPATITSHNTHVILSPLNVWTDSAQARLNLVT